MKNKDKIKQDFNLNIDSQKEFEKINGKMELVDDSISLMDKFSKLKKSMILTCSVLGALLVGSVGFSVVSVVRPIYRSNFEYLIINSLSAAKKYFIETDCNNVQSNEFTYLVNNKIVFNLYLINDIYFGQIFKKTKITDCYLEYSYSNFHKCICLDSLNTIWEFGEIKDKTIDISFYKNDQIIDNFSFKI